MRYINLLITYLLAYYGSLHPRVAGGPENLCHTWMQATVVCK